MRTVRILYFAWVRERIGRTEDVLELPAHVETVAQLMGWLKTRGPEYAAALERDDVVRVALDQAHAGRGDLLAGAREIAIFPPVTGG